MPGSARPGAATSPGAQTPARVGPDLVPSSALPVQRPSMPRPEFSARVCQYRWPWPGRQGNSGPAGSPLRWHQRAAKARNEEVSVPELSEREQQIRDTFNSQDTHLAGRMGIKILEASPERVVGTMPVEGNTQPYGLLHGGASCVLAESLGSLGSALQAGPDRVTVGIEINATHH